MYGPHIEKQFAHIEFENEQLRRKVATQRLIEAEYQHSEAPAPLAGGHLRAVRSPARSADSGRPVAGHAELMRFGSAQSDAS